MNNTKTIITDFTTGSVPKKLLQFTMPLVLSAILQTVYSMVDMIIVGNFLGGAALSGVSVGSDVLQVLTFASIGLANAGQIIMSQYIGAGRREKVVKLIGTLFSFLTLCAVFMTIFCFFIRSNILSWLNTPPEAWDYAINYVTTCILGLIFIYGYNMVSAILRGMGDSRNPLLFVAIASVLNIILDVLFVGTLNMGTFGAALATVIGQGTSFICALYVIYRKREEIGFYFQPSDFRIDKEVFFPLIRLGIPMMIQSAAVTLSKMFVNSWVNSYGYVASAVSGIGTKLETVCNCFSASINAAAGTMIAQNIGAEKYKRVPQIMKTSFIMAGSIAGFCALMTCFFPEVVFGLFCSEDEILAMAMTYIPVTILLYSASATRVPMNALINGSGYSRLNLAVALLDGIIARVGMALFLGLVCNKGVYGFWYGNTIAGFVPFFLGGAFYFSGKWKKKKAI